MKNISLIFVVLSFPGLLYASEYHGCTFQGKVISTPTVSPAEAHFRFEVSDLIPPKGNSGDCADFAGTTIDVYLRHLDIGQINRVEDRLVLTPRFDMDNIIEFGLGSELSIARTVVSGLTQNGLATSVIFRILPEKDQATVH